MSQQLPPFLRSVRSYLAELEGKYGQCISRSTFRRWLKGWGKVYKRARRSCKAHRDQSLFDFFAQELEALKAWEDSGEIDLLFFDEMGLNLVPSVPYGWQDRGKRVEIPSTKSANVSTAGFLARDNRLVSFVVEGAVTSELVVGMFEQLAGQLAKKTVVVLDNASTHTCKQFAERIPAWREKGLLIQYLPPHSPELNYIELLWQKIKYEWLDLEAFLSQQHLLDHLHEVLKQVGTKYRITFN